MKAKLLLLSAVMASAFSTGAIAQTYSGSTDRTIPRLCTNKCAQAGEQVAVDAYGNGYAVWLENHLNPNTGDVVSSLLASRFIASTQTWTKPQIIDQSWALGGSGGTRIVVNSANQATIVWTHNGGSYWYGGGVDLKSATWRGYWDIREVRRDFNVVTDNFTVGANKSGEIFVSYAVRNYDYRYDDIEIINMRKLKDGTWTNNWGQPEAFENIAVDEVGGAIGVEMRSGSYLLYTKRHDSSTRQWVDKVVHETYSNYNNIPNLATAVDPNGNVMMVYEVVNVSTGARKLKSRYFNKSTRTWTTKNLQGNTTGRLYGSISIAADRNKNFYVAYNQYSGSYIKTISARYTNSAGTWSWPKVVSKGNYHTREAMVTTDASSRAIYTWGQRTDTGTGSSTGKVFRMATSRYADSAWSWPSIYQDAWRIGYKPFAATDSYGRTLVIWNQDSTVSGVKELKSDRLQAR